MTEMPLKTKALLVKNYNIIDHLAFTEIDYDFDLLRNRFKKIYKEEFGISDRIIIDHQDTDIYLPTSTVGINLQNFFEVVREMDMPGYLFLFYTNHYGLKKEIDILCKNMHPADRPTIIESFLSNMHAPESYQSIDINIDNIKHHGLSMMGNNRVHRYALYNKLKHVSSEKLILSIRAPK